MQSPRSLIDPGDSPESSSSESETIGTHFHPIHPLLPPGYKNPKIINGIPVSTISFPPANLSFSRTTPIPSPTDTQINKTRDERDTNFNSN